MIINGGSRSNGGFFSKHLGNADKNERVKVVDIRGLSAQNISGCFREMKAVASGTRCKNYFYHANINILDREHLTPEQWEKAVDTLEKNLGLEGQARFVVEHEKEGRTHQHVIWSRIDVDKMAAIRMSKDYVKHQATARALEIELNLERGISVLGEDREGPRPERRPENWEVFRGKGSGIDPQKMKEQITEIWRRTDSAKKFASGLEAFGYVLAKGDRRNFCVVDSKGEVHSLARRITGAKAADLSNRLDSIKNSLPGIEQAKAYQRGRNPQQEGQRMLDQQQETERKKDAERDQEYRQEVIKKDEDQWREATNKEEERQQQAIKDADLKAEQQLKEQVRRQTEQAEELAQVQRNIDRYKALLAKQAEEGRRRASEAKTKELDFNNAHYRYGQALGQHYDIRDPYGSLARSAMAEYGSFLQERQNLDRQIAKAVDPQARQALELRKRIEAAEYMEITSHRIATQSEIIVGKRDTPEAVKQRNRAAAFHEEAQELRKEFRALQESRMIERENASPDKAGQRRNENGFGKTQPLPARETDATREQTASLKDHKPPEKEHSGKNKSQGGQAKEESTARALMVEDRIPGKPRGNERKLTDYVNTLPEKPASREFTKEQLRSDPAAKREQFSQLLSAQNREASLRKISQDMKANRNIDAKDISHLSRDDLKNIKSQGDDYLKAIVQQHERQREQGRER